LAGTEKRQNTKLQSVVEIAEKQIPVHFVYIKNCDKSYNACQLMISGELITAIERR